MAGAAAGCRLAAALGRRRRAAPARRDRGRDINLADADLNAFQAIHAAVQEAWSARRSRRGCVG